MSTMQKNSNSKHRPRDRVITFLTQDELKRLLVAVKDRRDRPIIMTAYRHGLRASEIGLLQRADLD
jgi:integrase